MTHSDRIDELEKKFSENPRRYFAPLANEYRKAGDLNRAIEICRSHLPQQPGHMSGHIVYGQALYESRKLAEAKGVFEAALGLDPENLIALRHLGDIARDSGDPQTARLWYLRVLDADPRNDEVAGMLTELEAATAAAPPAPTGTVGWGDINPERAAEGGKSGPKPIDLASPAAGAGNELAVEHASPDNDAFIASLETAPAGAAAATGSAGDDPLAQDPTWDSGAEGAPRPSAPTPVAAMRPVPAPSVPSRPPTSQADLDEQTFAEVDALFDEISTPETDAPSPAGARAAPKPPLGATIPAGEPPIGGDSVVAADVPGLETAEFIPPPREAPATVRVAPGAVDGLTSFGANDQQDAPTPAAFVTETMAELYLQQGFDAEALEIYRRLLSQNPNDSGLRDRVDQLERGSKSSLSVAAVSSEVIEAAQQRQRKSIGPARTARSFFGLLAGRRAPRQGGSVHDFAAETATEELTVMNPPARPEPPAQSARSGGSSRGPIGALFGSGSVSVEDEEAAAALAAAFGPSPGEVPANNDRAAATTTGRPARTGSQELSLDEIFRESGNRASAPKSGAYSFDQFFSPGSPPPSSGGGSAPDSDSPGSDDRPPGGDLEQFTAWLEGLKRK
jgi:tetratricopeptide (TPR) repeat protein